MTQKIWEKERVLQISDTQANWLQDQKLIWSCNDSECGDYHLENGVSWDVVDKALQHNVQ